MPAVAPREPTHEHPDGPPTRAPTRQGVAVVDPSRPARPTCWPLSPLPSADALGDGHDAVHLAQNRFLDELAVDHHQSRIGRLELGDDAAGPSNPIGRRREHRVQRRDLLGVHRALAAKAQIPCLDRGALHAVRILEIEVGHVDHIQPGAGGGMDHARAGIEQRLPLVLAAQLGGHVDAAEEHRVDARAATGDVIGSLEPGIGLDDHMQAGGVAALGQQVVEHHHLVRRAHLRHHQRRRRRFAGQDRLHVGNAEALAQRVDADDPLDPVLGLRALEELDRIGPRSRLVLGRDPVLELDTHDIRAARQGLREHLGPQARREDERAARANAWSGHERAFAVVRSDGASPCLDRIVYRSVQHLERIRL